MVITLLDTSFTIISVIDDYESFIWTDRYNKCGDFEYYSNLTREKLDLFRPGYYLENDRSEHTMIIEGVEIISDIEEGEKLKVTGRSLESLLDRRIVWKQTLVNGGVQNGVKFLIDGAFINPSIESRKIDNFAFKMSDDPRVISLKMETQYTGDNIYDVVTDLCDDNKMGFKIIRTEDNKFEFSLYFGTDRSDSQTEVQPVIFSQNYDNVNSIDYMESTETLKNITLVAGEGEGNARKTTVVGEASGLDRRELFTDARDMSSKTDTGTLSDAVYFQHLAQRGKEKLAENKMIRDFSGDVDVYGLYKYDVDFFLGDYVHFYDQFETGRRVRVDEMIFNENINAGYSYYPTFTVEDPDE